MMTVHKVLGRAAVGSGLNLSNGHHTVVSLWLWGWRKRRSVWRGLSDHLVGRSLNSVALGVLVIDEDVDLERLHVDEGLRTVIAAQRLAPSFL